MAESTSIPLRIHPVLTKKPLTGSVHRTRTQPCLASTTPPSLVHPATAPATHLATGTIALTLSILAVLRTTTRVNFKTPKTPQESDMVDTGLRSTVPETLLVAGQPTAMPPRTSTQETAQGLRLVDALALPVLPPPTLVNSRRLAVLQNQPTTLAAALLLHQGRIQVESTAKHHAAPHRQPTRLALTPPAHQGQMRSTVGLQVARLLPFIIPDLNASLVLRDLVLALPAMPTELAPTTAIGSPALRDPVQVLPATPTEHAPTTATAHLLQEPTRLVQFLPL
jgi:hypothetical protein